MKTTSGLSALMLAAYAAYGGPNAALANAPSPEGVKAAPVTSSFAAIGARKSKADVIRMANCWAEVRGGKQHCN